MTLTPRQRILAAVHGEQVDYLPCSIYFNGNLRVGRYDCSQREDQISLGLDLGVDPFMGFGMPWSMDPAVQITTWETSESGKGCRILWQAWETPEGRLTQAVRKEGECKEWNRVQWSDMTPAVIHKPLIETPDDIARFRYLVQPATEADYDAWLASVEPTLEQARLHDLPVVAVYGLGLATILFMQGAENAVYLAMDNPQGFEDLAEIVHQAEMRKIELAARGHIDILKRFGGYETCNFYSPEIFERVCVPRLRAEVDYAHSFGLPIYYRFVTGAEPILDKIASIGFDCIEGGEPHLSNCSLEMWHDAFTGKATSWTGVSTPVLLGGNDPEAVRKEVRHCVEVFGKTGFILGVTNSIRRHFPWENTLAMIDEWKKVR